MMVTRSIVGKGVWVPAAIAALMLLMIVPSASAANSFCQSVIPSSISYSSLGGLVSFSLIIMLLMALITGIVLMVGYGLRIQRFIEFSRKEFAEIGLTILIVLILLSGFAGISSVFAPSALLSGFGINYSNAIFSNDCASLYNAGIDFLYNSISLAVLQDMYSLGASFKVVAMPLGFGVSFSPLAGLATATAPVSNIMMFLGGITAITLGIAALLGVLYAVMPIFLFFGIILRTMPWTRAAGGAMLGFFVAFFIFFPSMLGFLLNDTPALPTTTTLPSAAIGSSISNIVIGLFSTLNPSVIVEYLINYLAVQVYVLLAIAMAFILSFDFGDSLGDLLGAPSLGTGDSLKKVL